MVEAVSGQHSWQTSWSSLLNPQTTEHIPPESPAEMQMPSPLPRPLSGICIVTRSQVTDVCVKVTHERWVSLICSPFSHPLRPRQRCATWVWCAAVSQIRRSTGINICFSYLAKAKFVFGAISLPAACGSLAFLAGVLAFSRQLLLWAFFYTKVSMTAKSIGCFHFGWWGFEPWPCHLLAIKPWASHQSPTWSSGSSPIKKEQ